LNETGAELFPGISDVLTSETVHTQTLEGFFAERAATIFPAQTLLKLDVQGAEMDVLKGAGPCLSGLAGLLLELSIQPIYDGAPDYLESLSYLQAAGFDPIGFYPANRAIAGRILEFDCLLSNRNKAPVLHS
jgi:hypothetical protein